MVAEFRGDSRAKIYEFSLKWENELEIEGWQVEEDQRVAWGHRKNIFMFLYG